MGTASDADEEGFVMVRHDRMIGDKGHKCVYGCCRDTAPSGRKQERRWLKRRERQFILAEILNNKEEQ